MSNTSARTAHVRLPFWRQLRWNLMFFFLLLAIVPLVAVQTFTLYQNSTQAKKQVFDQLQSIGKLKFNQIQQWLVDDRQVLRMMIDPDTAVTFAQLIALPSQEIQSTVDDQLASVVQRTSQAGLFDKFFIYNSEGEIVAGSSADDVGKLVSRQLYFQQSLKESYTQPPYYDLETGKLMAVQTLPLLSINGDKVVGVLAGILDIPRLGKIMTESSGLGETGETYLVSKANNHLVTPSRFPGYSINLAYHSQGIDNALAEQTGSSVYIDFRGVSVLGFYQWIPELQLGLVSEQAESEALAASQNVFNNSLLILLIVSAIDILIGVFRITQITNPLELLTDIAAQIADGNLNLRAGIKQRNEIGRLGEAFDQMTIQLADSIETLEQHVKERTQDLEIARLRAERASRAKSTFLSNMSHELRTPLNIIIGYTSSMLDMPVLYDNLTLSPAHERDVKLVKDSGYYLLGLINDILDLSKIEAGKLELHPKCVDLPIEFKAILANSIGLVKDKPIQIKPDFPDYMPKVWADSTRVRQIILNLMSNAIKFTRSGSVTLHARLEGQNIVISVIDTGIGIPEKVLEVIFDRFQQAESDTDKHYGGTGLGLDISKQLARMHGSDLTVQSVVGQGSKFIFTLPLANKEQLDTPIIPDTIGKSVKSFVVTEPVTASAILLVDDDAGMRDMIRQNLEGANYVVIDVQNGLGALEMIKGLTPDLIILDIHQPNLAGWQLLKSLKFDSELAKIPVIACSADEYGVNARQLGANVFLKRPFSPDELLACTQQLLPILQ